MEYRKNVITLIIGIAIMAVPFIIKHQDKTNAEAVIESFSQETVKKQTTEETIDIDEHRKNQKSDDKEILPSDAIGFLEIPTLSLRYPIYEGTSDTVLDMGIGHLSESAGLFEKGNCVLAGHNGSSRGEFFTNLSSISIGDEVILTDDKKVTHTYIVEDTGITGPFDQTITESKDDECLTLFTCAYYGNQRFFCRCYIKK